MQGMYKELVAKVLITFMAFLHEVFQPMRRLKWLMEVHCSSSNHSWSYRPRHLLSLPSYYRAPSILYRRRFSNFPEIAQFPQNFYAIDDNITGRNSEVESPEKDSLIPTIFAHLACLSMFISRSIYDEKDLCSMLVKEIMHFSAKLFAHWWAECCDALLKIFTQNAELLPNLQGDQACCQNRQIKTKNCQDENCTMKADRWETK